MKNKFVKLFAAFMLSFIGLICAGCFQGESNLTIDEGGQVTLKTELMGVPLLSEHIEGWKNDWERSNSVTEITPIASGNMSGYRITTRYASMEQFAAQNIDLYGRRGNSKGIQQRKGWFYDAYSFDFLSEAPEESAEYLDNPFVQSMMPQIKFDMVINLPYAAEKNNSHHATNDNKTLTWNMAASITSGKNVSMQAEFKIWHKDKILLTGALIVTLLGGAIYFFQKAQHFSEDKEAAAKNLRYMQICAGLAAAIISASTFLLLEPVTFTDADIISKLAPPR